MQMQIIVIVIVFPVLYNVLPAFLIQYAQNVLQIINLQLTIYRDVFATLDFTRIVHQLNALQVAMVDIMEI